LKRSQICEIWPKKDQPGNTDVTFALKKDRKWRETQ